MPKRMNAKYKNLVTMYLFALENYPSIFYFMLANHDMMESEMTYFFN